MVYAGAGGFMGAQNADWLGPGRDANALLPFLGVGAALVIVALRGTSFHHSLRESPVGRWSGYLLTVGAALYVVSWAIQFAIFGTLTLAFGLICLSITIWARRVLGMTDRILATISAIGSLTWNTETASAFLLVGVGVIWAILAVRLLMTESFTGSDRPANV